MGHKLVIGRTGSGKSAIVKQIGSELRTKSGLPILAFNPLNEKGYARRDNFDCVAADYETTDPDIFVATVKKYLAENNTPSIVLIIDECQNFFSHRNSEHIWLATQGRHFGITIIAISQKATMVNPTFRGQCDTIYLFQTTLTDARFMADEFGKMELRNACNLLPGEFFRCDNRGVIKLRVPRAAA